MSSLQSQKFSVSGPTTFPLSKFSFATVSGELVKPIPWTHISDKGHLFAVFEIVSIPSHNSEMVEKNQFRVLADPEVLEDLDLKVLAHEAIKAAEDMKTLPSPSRFPAVTIIVQEPCIAVRFPLRSGQVSRFQLKFKLQSDFYKALALFSQAGCPITQAGSLVPSVHGACANDSASGVVVCQSSNSQESHQHSVGRSEAKAIMTGVGTSKASSSRPSTSSDASWRSERPSSYSSMISESTTKQPLSGKPEISPFFSDLDHTKLAANGDVNQRAKFNAHPVGETNHVHSLPSSAPAPQVVSNLEVGENSLLVPISCQPTHRPSTAPACDSENLYHMLPPRRKLPFKAKPPRKGSKYSRAHQDILEPGRKSAEKSTASISLSAKQQTDESLDILERGTVTDRLNSVACQGMTVSQSSLRGQTVRKDTIFVNAVEQGVDTSGSNSQAPKINASTANGNADVRKVPPPGSRYGNIQTQASLARVNEGQQWIGKRKSVDWEASRLPLAKRADHGTGRDMAASCSRGEMASTSNSRTPEMAVADSQGCYIDTAQDQAPERKMLNGDDCCGSCNEGEAPRTSRRTHQPVSATSTGNEITQQSLTDIPNSAQSGRQGVLGNKSVMTLMNDPDFARIPETIQWGALPPEKREAALETWICRQLESDNFATLVKDLEGMWQRLFLGV